MGRRAATWRTWTAACSSPTSRSSTCGRTAAATSRTSRVLTPHYRGATPRERWRRAFTPYRFRWPGRWARGQGGRFEVGRRSSAGRGVLSVTRRTASTPSPAFGFTAASGPLPGDRDDPPGVCMGAQYCAFMPDRLRGDSRPHFFLKLGAMGYATSLRPAHSRARLFHIHHKPMYAALGEVNTRLRRPTPLARAVERLMVLDAVTDDRSLTWLGTERDKVSYFRHASVFRGRRFPRRSFAWIRGATRASLPRSAAHRLSRADGARQPSCSSQRSRIRRRSGCSWSGTRAARVRSRSGPSGWCSPGTARPPTRLHESAFRDQLVTPLRVR